MSDIKLDSCVCVEYALLLSLLSRRAVSFPPSISVDQAAEYVKIVAPTSKWSKDARGSKFTPGPLVCGKHRSKVNRIPSTLPYIILLSLFAGDKLNVELSGITNYKNHSVDLFKITYYKIFRAFDLPRFDLDIKKRGFGPLGEGIVAYSGKCVRKILPIKLSDGESITKIRGFVITARVGSDSAKRMISKIKTEMSSLANTKVLCIVNNRNDSGPSPGCECSILGESGSGVVYETVSSGKTAERMAEQCCVGFLETVGMSRIFDYKLLPDVVLLMGLADGVSHLLIGQIDDRTKDVLELLKVFFKVSHSLEKCGDDQILTVVGCGYSNRYMEM